jgi:4-carboxymuconolactone decarboxylase
MGDLMTTTSSPRIAPLEPPYDQEVARTLQRMMPPGVDPLKLFRTVAHNPKLLDKLRSTGAYLLNFGTLDPREREIVIHRPCARCGCAYEWGVHVAAFARPLGFSEEEIEATVRGGADTPPWTEREALLVRLVDELHDTAGISDDLWEGLAAEWSPAQLVELITLVGQYHAVSFVANGLQVEQEDAAPRFPRRETASGSGPPHDQLVDS